MKSYSEKSYLRHREDIARSQPDSKPWDEYTREELIIKFLPLVEAISRSFNSSDLSSGILDLMDLIQYGSIGLISAVDKFDAQICLSKPDPEKSIKSFLAKKIKGAIRRSIDNNRGTMKVTEYRQNEIRKTKEGVELIFNSIFKSIDAYDSNGYNQFYNIPEINKTFNVEILNKYLLSMMKNILNTEEYHIVRMFYGLDCRKRSAKEIVIELGIDGNNSNVKVSTIKKAAIDKLINKINPEIVLGLM
jgi:RNA polymerase sigma factor (sigma-70 family)